VVNLTMSNASIENLSLRVRENSTFVCLYVSIAAILPLLIVCCLAFGAGEWICKACASTLGLKTGIEGHEWEADEVEEKEEENQSAPREEDKGNALVDSDDEDNSNVVDLVDSDDEEAVPVRRKKRRKVLEDSDSDDE